MTTTNSRVAAIPEIESYVETSLYVAQTFGVVEFRNPYNQSQINSLQIPYWISEEYLIFMWYEYLSTLENFAI